MYCAICIFLISVTSKIHLICDIKSYNKIFLIFYSTSFFCSLYGDILIHILNNIINFYNNILLTVFNVT